MRLQQCAPIAADATPQGKRRWGGRRGFHDGHAEGLLYILWYGGGAVRLDAKLMATSPVPTRGI